MSVTHARTAFGLEETSDDGAVEYLSVRECFARVESTEFGHLALSDRAIPYIVPVRVQISGRRLHVTPLRGVDTPLREGAIVALEVTNVTSSGAVMSCVEVRGHLRATERCGRLEILLEMISGWSLELATAPTTTPLHALR